MRNLSLLIAIYLLVSCGNQNSIQPEEVEIPKQDEISTIQENEDELTAKFLMPIRGAIHNLSEREFANEISIETFADSLELLFDDYKQALFLMKIDSTEYSDMYNGELIIEFIKDTLWLQGESSLAMYYIGLNTTTHDMIQNNKYGRELANRLVNKYYQILLNVLPNADKTNLITSHKKWQNSIDSDYNLASGLTKQKSGTMSLYTWSTEVDELLIQRAIFYFNLYQYRLPDSVIME